MPLDFDRVKHYFNLRYKHDLTWQDASFWYTPYVVEEDDEEDEDVLAARLTAEGTVKVTARGAACGKGCCGLVHRRYEFPLTDLDRSDEDLIAEFEATSKAYASALEAEAAERARVAAEKKEKAERAELARLLAKYGVPEGSSPV